MALNWRAYRDQETKRMALGSADSRLAGGAARDRQRGAAAVLPVLEAEASREASAAHRHEVDGMVASRPQTVHEPASSAQSVGTGPTLSWQYRYMTLPVFDSDKWVLRVEVVRQAIKTLQSVHIHENFVVYMHVSRRGGQVAGKDEPKQLAGINPDWLGEVRDWLDVPGGPPSKPNFLPFSSRGSDPTRFWKSSNLAGSYAPSSLRSMKSIFVGPDKTYGLPITADGAVDTSKLKEVLLAGASVPAWAIAAFVYRNRGFIAPSQPHGVDLIEIFRDDFSLTLEEQASLFSWDLPVTDFFEPFSI
ncbi:hypothetical protein [Streptomyces sp. NPDC002250]|uniref:hypothetical protein n=1 Tax=Streptomyces sp. NPDC002250 TaxID=3364641 RepID=UPI00368B5AD4